MVPRDGKSLYVSEFAHTLMRECVRIAPLVDVQGEEPQLASIKGCVDLAAVLLYRTFARRVDQAGLLHLLSPELLAQADYQALTPSDPGTS